MTASMVDDRITPDENVSRPSRMPREASSSVRMVLSGAISMTTRRVALAPMSSTATISPFDGGGVCTWKGSLSCPHGTT